MEEEGLISQLITTEVPECLVTLFFYHLWTQVLTTVSRLVDTVLPLCLVITHSDDSREERKERKRERGRDEVRREGKKVKKMFSIEKNFSNTRTHIYTLKKVLNR